LLSILVDESRGGVPSLTLQKLGGPDQRKRFPDSLDHVSEPGGGPNPRAVELITSTPKTALVLDWIQSPRERYLWGKARLINTRPIAHPLEIVFGSRPSRKNEMHVPSEVALLRRKLRWVSISEPGHHRHEAGARRNLARGVKPL